MKNKNGDVINATHSVSIGVWKTAQQVFDHLIHDVPKFWPEQLEGDCSKLNDEFVFRSGDSHYSKSKVIELIPDKKVVWLVMESIRKTDNFNWTGTKMIFEIIPKGNATEVRFTYDGIVLKSEIDRLALVCDLVMKNLYNLIEVQLKR